MDWLELLQTLVIALAGIAIPYLGLYLKGFLTTGKRRHNAEMIAITADAILSMVIKNNPTMSLLEQIDYYKDLLVAEMLRDPTVPLNNAVVANRVAVDVIEKRLQLQGDK